MRKESKVMMNRIDYQIKDSLCEAAIKEFKMPDSVPAKLNKYSELFDSISIKPKGLPKIALSHLGDETFENIQRFAHLFEKIDSFYK